MDRTAFEDELRAAGFSVGEAELQPGRSTDEHTHAWDIRGMVLEGEFTVLQGDDAVTCRPGETFEVAAGVPHAERHGPTGGRLLVGRRQRGD